MAHRGAPPAPLPAQAQKYYEEAQATGKAMLMVVRGPRHASYGWLGCRGALPRSGGRVHAPATPAAGAKGARRGVRGAAGAS